MNKLQENIYYISQLKMQNPERFQGFQIDGKNLFYNGQFFDLTNADFSSIQNSQQPPSPEQIISALTSFNQNSNTPQANENINETKLQLMRERNPEMSCITIFYNLDPSKGFFEPTKDEYWNIRTHDGKNHLFKNINHLDIFSLYKGVQDETGKDIISAEEFTREINKWFFGEKKLEPAEAILTRPDIPENTKAQIQEYVNMYKDQNYINVETSIEENIIYINNQRNPEDSKIITFSKNINGNLEAEVHKNNVSSVTTTSQTISSQSTEPQQPNVVSTDQKINNEQQTQILQYNNPNAIIDDNTFYQTLIHGNYTDTIVQQIGNYLTNLKETLPSLDSNTKEAKLKAVEQCFTDAILLGGLSENDQIYFQKWQDFFTKTTESFGASKGQTKVLIPPGTPIHHQKEPDQLEKAGFSNIISIILLTTSIVLGLTILALYFLHR